jgi:hypothetical protein
MRRASLLPFVLSCVVGLAGGLYYAWQIEPVEYVDNAPDTLRADFKSDYLALIAAAFASTEDIPRAQQRLDLFSDPDPARTLAALAQQRLAGGRSESEARALAQLASVLGEQPTPYVQTPETSLPSDPTNTPDRRTPRPASRTPTSAVMPTRTPTPEAARAFELQSRAFVCDPDVRQPLVQAIILNSQGRNLPGIEVLVVWDTGQDHFFTGLKPELGLGYGDFTMTEGVTYAAQIAGSTELITDLSAEACVDTGGEAYLGSWLLVFRQRSTP